MTITSKVVSSNPIHGEVYSIQHYVVNFVSDLRQVGSFLHQYNWSQQYRYNWNIPIETHMWKTNTGPRHFAKKLTILNLRKVWVPPGRVIFLTETKIRLYHFWHGKSLIFLQISPFVLAVNCRVRFFWHLLGQSNFITKAWRQNDAT